ncbi:hypothetical protein AB0B25_23925 [Nocardia sp. NPDC049190]|uniref:GNAT family N-acetyltransferase n=1 Tax=Nocardia sp. NPDC049190 TaxID=3155650 RepID=UPI0033EEE219
MPDPTTDVVAADVFGGGTQPTLSGDIVTLRPWSAADAPVVHSAYQDPDVQRWHVRSGRSRSVMRWWDAWGCGA